MISTHTVCIALLVVSTMVLPVSAQESADGSPGEIVFEFISAYNSHDLPSMLSLVHPDVQWLSIDRDTVSVQTNGAKELAESLRGYFESIPSSRSTVESMLQAGRFVSVWERAHWERGGESATQSSLAVYEVLDGSIRRIWYYPAMK